jgi:peptidoglycan-associated lipoprotein
MRENSMKRIVAISLVLAGAALLAGCPKKSTVAETPNAGSEVAKSADVGAGGPSTMTSPLGGEANATGAAAGEANGLARVVYFDFDKSDIKPEYVDLVAAHARNLTAHPNVKIKLEGNTDERGTREYNIGLGERRAQSVRRALMLQGVGESQITTVSFGAERPAAEGDDEGAWSKNRRVELVYLP